jgi:hypothetical protein
MYGAPAIDRRDAAAPDLARERPPPILAEGSGVRGCRRFAGDVRAALQLSVVAADVLGITVAGIASYLILEGRVGLPAQYWGQIIIVCVDSVLVMQIAGTYRFAALRRPGGHLMRLTGLWAAVVLALIALLQLNRRADEYSLAWILLWMLGWWFVLLATRFLAWRTIRRFRRHLTTQIAVVGDPVAARHLAQRLADDADRDTQIIGVFRAKDFLGRGSDRHADARARMRAGDRRIDEIVLAMPCNDVPDLDAALGKLGACTVDIKLGFGIRPPRRNGIGQLVLAPVRRRPLAGLPAALKRAIDTFVRARSCWSSPFR